jgi:hypothetical protein
MTSVSRNPARSSASTATRKEILFKHPVTEPQKKQDVRAELALWKKKALSHASS